MRISHLPILIVLLLSLKAFACPPAAEGGQAGGHEGTASVGSTAGSSAAGAAAPVAADAVAAKSPVARDVAAEKDSDSQDDEKLHASAPAPYTPKMWSCSCSNIPGKTCDKGFVFTSIADATRYSKQACGKECVPFCTGHATPAPAPRPTH